MPNSARIQMDADPEWSDSFLGPEPDFAPADLPVWSLYWTARRSTGQDALGGPMPIDLSRALDLYERLHGPPDSRRLAEKLQAMDAAFLTGLPKKPAKPNEGK